MKRCLTGYFVALTLMSLSPALAQVNPNLLGQNQIQSGNMIATGSYTSYENEPFLPQEWRKGTVRATDGKVYAIERLRYNAHEDRPEYEIDGKSFTFTLPIAGFALEDGKGQLLRFQNGFRPIDQQRERSFYEVLHDGKTKLLRYRKATLLDVTQYNSATKQKRFDFSEQYYVVRPDGTPVRVKRDKKSLLDALSDKGPQLEAFISQNKLKFRDWADAQQLLAHYESL